MDWTKFDNAFDLDGFREEIKEAATNTGNTREYREVTPGKYECSVEKIELRESKKGDPMVTIWFSILNGEFQNSKLFVNQLVNEGWKINQVNELLRSFESGVDIKFESFSQYSEMLTDVFEAVNGKLEFLIDYSQSKTGFPRYSVEEVYEVQ